MPDLFAGFHFARLAAARITSFARSSPMTQPEGDRIFAALSGDFVEEGFDRKHISLRAERPQRDVRIGMVVRRWLSICQDGKS
jgi:hypothetical protein